jgi:hypothetical protein
LESGPPSRPRFWSILVHCSAILRDLADRFPRNAEDEGFTYVDADIDELSQRLGICWELSTSVPFGPEVPYLGFLWDLEARARFVKRSGSSTSRQSQNGRRSACTISSKRSGYTVNYSTPFWSSYQDALTSPAWRPCSPSATIVLSYRAPLPGALQTIWPGKNSASVTQTSPDPLQVRVSTLDEYPRALRGEDCVCPGALGAGVNDVSLGRGELHNARQCCTTPHK